MYLLLESISEFLDRLDRFSLVMVAGLLGILVMGLIWRKMPKPDPSLKEAKIQRKRIAKVERKVKAIRRKFDPARKHIPCPDLVELIIIAGGALSIFIYLAVILLLRS